MINTTIHTFGTGGRGNGRVTLLSTWNIRYIKKIVEKRRMEFTYLIDDDHIYNHVYNEKIASKRTHGQ